MILLYHITVRFIFKCFLVFYNKCGVRYTENRYILRLKKTNQPNGCQGPMWRLIRGSGLAYGYSVRPSPHEGRIVFSLYKATNTVPAYTKAKSILVSTTHSYHTRKNSHTSSMFIVGWVYKRIFFIEFKKILKLV